MIITKVVSEETAISNILNINLMIFFICVNTLQQPEAGKPQGVISLKINQNQSQANDDDGSDFLKNDSDRQFLFQNLGEFF